TLPVITATDNEFFEDLVTAEGSASKPVSVATATKIKQRSGLTARTPNPADVAFSNAAAGATETVIGTGKGLVLNALTFGGYSTYGWIKATVTGYQKGGVDQAMLSLMHSAPLLGTAMRSLDAANAYHQGDYAAMGSLLGGVAVEGVLLG